jgi:hypothetical protein
VLHQSEALAERGRSDGAAQRAVVDGVVEAIRGPPARDRSVSDVEVELERLAARTCSSGKAPQYDDHPKAPELDHVGGRVTTWRLRRQRRGANRSATATIARPAGPS